MVSIARVLLVAAVAVTATGVRAEDAETQTVAEKQTCVAPEIVTNYETKIDSLESERTRWQSQLVAANAQWKKDKTDLEEQLTEQQALQKKSQKELKKVQQESAKKIAALEKQLRDRDAQHAHAVEALEKQIGAGETQHVQTLEQLEAQVAELQQTVEQLQTQVEQHKVELSEREAEVTDAKAKLAKSQGQVRSLERDVASSLKKNKLLRDELEKLDEKLTISALLSSYYDEGVVLAADAVTALRLQIESAQEGATPGVTQALAALETYKKTVTETTDKLYTEHLAATLDPLIADLQRASQPYVKEYRPLLEAELARLQKVAIANYHVALKRGKAARKEAIALLRQTDGVAPYAQQIVDGSLFVLAAPIAFVLVRLVLSLVWFMVRTTFCVMTLGYCCGLCARKRSKSKRKGSRKPLSPSPSSTAVAAPSASKKSNTTTTASASSNSKRTGGGKKQK